MEEQNQSDPQIITISPSQPEGEGVSGQTQLKYAGFWIRFVANFIDGIILQIIAGIAGFIIGLSMGIAGVDKNIASIVGLLVSVIVGLAYWLTLTYKYSATWGKMIVGLKVVSDKAEQLSFGQVLLRETIGKFVSGIIFLAGYIMAAFTQKKQSLHDKIAGTLVVYKDPSKKTNVWVIVAIVIVAVLFVIVVIGFFGSVVLVSLQSARNRAQDESIKATMRSIIPAAIIYKDTNTSYAGFTVPAGAISCSGQPIVNISSNGKQMAVFMKSCKDKTKYFCADPEKNITTETAEVDESYVKSGAVICSQTDNSPKDISENMDKGNDVNKIELQNNFKDPTLGYEIGYPENWVQQREYDKETGVTTITFLPNRDNLSATIYVQSVESDHSVSLADVDEFVSTFRGEIVKSNGKVYDEKDFVYTYPDGTTSNGRAFKSEYDENGINLKQWLIAIPSGNKMHWLTYVSDISQYDANLQTVIAMLDFWKISK